MSKCRLLSRAELDAARFAGDGEDLAVLAALYVEPESVVATNGHYLIKVPVKIVMDPEDFPVVPGMSEEAPTLPVNIPAQVALDTSKSLKKGRIPILEYAALSGAYQLTTTDLESPRMASFKPVEGQFPLYEKVIPTAEPTLQTAFNAKYLKTICEYAIKHGSGRAPMLKMDFTDAAYPAKITISLEDGREVLVVLMPMKR